MLTSLHLGTPSGAGCWSINILGRIRAARQPKPSHMELSAHVPKSLAQIFNVLVVVHGFIKATKKTPGCPGIPQIL